MRGKASVGWCGRGHHAPVLTTTQCGSAADALPRAGGLQLGWAQEACSTRLPAGFRSAPRPSFPRDRQPSSMFSSQQSRPRVDISNVCFVRVLYHRLVQSESHGQAQANREAVTSVLVDAERGCSPENQDPNAAHCRLLVSGSVFLTATLLLMHLLPETKNQGIKPGVLYPPVPTPWPR